jgi:hypothetical protein
MPDSSPARSAGPWTASRRGQLGDEQQRRTRQVWRATRQPGVKPQRRSPFHPTCCSRSLRLHRRSARERLLVTFQRDDTATYANAVGNAPQTRPCTSCDPAKLSPFSAYPAFSNSRPMGTECAVQHLPPKARCSAASPGGRFAGCSVAASGRRKRHMGRSRSWIWPGWSSRPRSSGFGHRHRRSTSIGRPGLPRRPRNERIP